MIRNKKADTKSMKRSSNQVENRNSLTSTIMNNFGGSNGIHIRSQSALHELMSGRRQPSTALF